MKGRKGLKREAEGKRFDLNGEGDAFRRKLAN